ncbi:type II secretion system protein GspM [Pseudomonas sp. NPDC090202]|uniref:type II secretion system protein GspM n=1 Tax=unclassified Pseudomonas TaxID=196821 RepID=UPI00382E3087
MKWPAMAQQRWQQLAPRDRRMLTLLGVFLLVVLGFNGLWQPAQNRLEQAEKLYRQRLALAGQIQQAAPAQSASSDQPLSRRLNDRATATGLELLQLDEDQQTLRLTLSGDPSVLLDWLIQAERDGAVMQSLILEKQDARLQASVVWRLD